MKKHYLYSGITIIVILLLAFFLTHSAPEPEQGNQSGENSSNVLQIPTGSEDHLVYALEEDSVLRWEASMVIGNGHRGEVDFRSGFLVFEDDAFSEGAFVVDMATIEEDKDNQRVEAHLKNEDFFDVQNFPFSTFEIREVVEQGGDQFEVTGDLTILDTTKPLTFIATMSQTEGVLSFNADFSIDRTEWGITFRSDSVFSGLGDKAIKDEIRFSLDLSFGATGGKR